MLFLIMFLKGVNKLLLLNQLSLNILSLLFYNSFSKYICKYTFTKYQFLIQQNFQFKKLIPVQEIETI